MAEPTSSKISYPSSQPAPQSLDFFALGPVQGTDTVNIIPTTPPPVSHFGAMDYSNPLIAAIL